jgi:hypothetical protein
MLILAAISIYLVTCVAIGAAGQRFDGGPAPAVAGAAPAR